MPSTPPRVATLVICTAAGEMLGALPPFETVLPWWQNTTDLVRGARERYGVDVTVLRLLEATLPTAPGGAVTYLAQLAGALPAGLPLETWRATPEDHPLPLSYARPGGPGRDLAWATERLAEQGVKPSAPPEQMRTWNLSALWQIPVESGHVSLKCVPPFFAHEGRVLSRLAGARVPTLNAASDEGRILMAEIPGEDLYGAGRAVLLPLVKLLVDLQLDWVGREAELLDLGLPDWRGPALSVSIESVARRNAQHLADDDRRTVSRFVAGLVRRFDAIDECGLPDTTIVHGDFSPGNARGDGEHLVLLDWGDCGVGHPLLDQASFFDRTPSEDHDVIGRHWQGLWQGAVPGSDVARAARLLAPVAAARQAVIYQGFLDRIEPSEHPYHRHDSPQWLSRVAALVRTEAG
jgi:hypothetical protein